MYLIGTIERLILASVALSLINIIPFAPILVESNRDYGVNYFYLHLFSLLLVFILRKKISKPFKMLVGPITVLLIIKYGSAIVPFYMPTDRTITNDNLKIIFGEEVSSIDLQGVASAPDMVALAGVKNLGSSDLSTLFAHVVSVKSEESGTELALYSKYPFAAQPITQIGESYEHLPPVIIADVVLSGGKRIGIVVFKTLDKSSPENIVKSDLLVRRVGVYLRHYNYPFVIATQLNSAPTTSLYGRLKYATKSLNAANGFGLFATDSMAPIFLGAMLDHIFIRGARSVSTMTQLPHGKGAHIPYFVEVNFSAP